MTKNELNEKHLKSYLSATRRLIDPNRAVLAGSPPTIVGGGAVPVTKRLILAGAHAANSVDADLLYLDFFEGEEKNGPSNIIAAMNREGECYVQMTCRFWLDELGQPFLVSSDGEKRATISFNSNGMDMQLGAPCEDLEAGYERASAKLSELAAASFATSQDGIHKVPLKD